MRGRNIYFESLVLFSSLSRFFKKNFLFLISYTFSVFLFFLGWVSSTLPGLFLFSLSAYFLVDQFGGRVFSLGDLIIHFSELSIEAKSSIASSFITAIGFYVAFSIGQKSWERQKRIDLTFDIMNGLTEIVSEILNHAFFLKGYYKVAGEAHDILIKDRFSEKGIVNAIVIKDKRSEIELSKNKILVLSKDANTYIGNNCQLFYSKWEGENKIDYLRDCLDEIVHSSQAVIGDFSGCEKDFDIVNAFMKIATIEKYNDREKDLDKGIKKLNRIHGVLRGQFLSPIFKTSFNSVVLSIKIFSDLVKISKDIKNDLKENKKNN